MLVGPTAVGKTAVALALAEHLPVAVVSADARQIYRRLDIGTAKPTRREQARVPHFGLDVAEPGERYSAGRYALEAQEWLAAARAAGRVPILAGGTGLYIRAVAEGLFREPPMDASRRTALGQYLAGQERPELARWAARLDPGYAGGGRHRAARAIEVALLSGYPLSWWQRAAQADAAIDPWYVRLTLPRAVLHQRIAARSADMLRRGLVEEVAAVLAEGHLPGAPGLDAIGVREAVEYLHGRRARDTIAEAVTIATRQYARRQETWLRHQLGRPAWALDATRPAEDLARQIAERWREATASRPSPVPALPRITE